MDHRNPFQPYLDRHHPRHIPPYPPPPSLQLPPPRPLSPTLAGETCFYPPYVLHFPQPTIQVPPPMVPPPLPSQLPYHRHPLPPPPLLPNPHHTQFTFLNTGRRPIDDGTLPRGEDRHANLEFENSRTDSWGLSRGSPPFRRPFPGTDPERPHFHSVNMHTPSLRQSVDEFSNEPKSRYGFSRDCNDRFDCDGYRDNERFVSNSSRRSRNPPHDHFSPDSGESFGVEGWSDNYRRGRRPGFESAGINENLHTPWKKPQKKSALLRLQKPAPRNRTDLSALPFDGSPPIPCRGREPAVHSDHKLEATREGSPVELDVSFRSNSLVGKAVAVPSDPADICDRNLSQRIRKLRKFTEPKAISSSLQLTKSHSSPVNSSDGFTHVAHGISSPNDELKLSDDRVEISGKKAIFYTDSSLCSTGIITPLSMRTVKASEEHAISDTVDSLIECDGAPLVEDKKKMEVEIATSCSAGIWETKKFDKSLNTTDSFCSPSAASRSFTDLKLLKEKITSDGTIMKSEALLQLSLNEDISKECATAQSMFSDESCTVVDPGQSRLHNNERQPISNCLLAPSNSEKSNTDGPNGSTAIVRDNVNDFNGSSMKCKIKREAFTGASSRDSFGGCESVHALEIGTRVVSSLDGCVTQPGDEADVPATPGLLPSMGMGNCLEETTSMPIVSQGDVFGNECSKLKGLCADMCSVSKSPFLRLHADLYSGSVAEQKENAPPATGMIEHQNDIVCVDEENEHSSALKPLISDLPPGTVTGCDSFCPEKDGSSLVSNLGDLCPHVNEASNTKYDSWPIVLSPNESCNTDSAKNLSSDTERLVLNSSLPWKTEFDERAVTNDNLMVPVSNSLSNNPNASFFYATQDDHLSPPESVELPSKDLKEIAGQLKPKGGVPHRQNRQLTYAAPRGYPSRPPHAFNSSKTSVSSNGTGRLHTWHRTVNLSGVSRGTSYVRKGNSLVRKSASLAKNICGLSSSAPLLSVSSKNEMKTSAVADDRVDMMGPPNCSAVELTASLERPVTCSMQHSSKPSNCNSTTSGDDISSPQESPPFEECSENLLHLSKVAETKDASACSEDPLIYVKGKPNQLAAASNSSDTSVHDVNKICASVNDYYKRKRNQLIRTSLKNQSGPAALVPGESSISEGQMGLIVPSKSLSRRRLESVKKHKPSKFVFMSKPVGAQLLKKSAFPTQLLKRPALQFQSKRATSMIGRKLLLSRKRDAVYTRSSYGFSLRKSKFLSIGGSSLKWSKSIEKRSRNANEEATKAVAEVERRKRRPDDTRCVTSRTDRNRSSGERIFRIGPDRYKMDSSGRTLQRIADEKSFSTTIQSGNNLRKSYVPRRLLVGNDEYIQIGNGNQLIRDPKKRTRILASEKVRWSLRTARLRAAKKSKYCQFYTRFGHCNKDGGKCPFIHDPSKIVVCTKFLRGLCSNLYCRLTHQVIPERMQDCSYFVQGLCTNEKCPYRHVNVNPTAAICEGFLKGYCADGNECRKKHSYVCQDYEASGSCSQGSKCKLHHPKKKNQGRKRKRAEGMNAGCRYFGVDPEPKSRLSGRHSTVNGYDDGDDIFLKDGSFADYVRLDVSDEEPGGDCIHLDDPTVVIAADDEPTIGIQFDDLDPDLELDLEKVVKPFRLMD